MIRRKKEKLEEETEKKDIATDSVCREKTEEKEEEWEEKADREVMWAKKGNMGEEEEREVPVEET